MNLQQLLDAIQTEKYATQPLAAHRIAGLDGHTREHYALLLAAVLRVRPTIGAAQSRLFALLLDAMGLANRQASLFGRTQTLTAADLSESRRLIAEHGLAQSFLLDTCVLLRLEEPPSDDDLRLCAELADLLQIGSATLSALVTLALQVLGLQRQTTFPDVLDPCDCPHWFEFICEEVTAAKLKEGLPPGLWILKRVIDMDTGWSLEYVTLFFVESGQLNTYTLADEQVTINGCRLINPVMQFKNKALAFNMQGSIVDGRYPEHAQLTAFCFDSIKSVNFNNTFFSTRNARAIRVTFTPFQLTQCEFTDCGNEHLVGGALAIRIPENKDIFKFRGLIGITKDITLADCQFTRCTARLGGALRIDRLDYRLTSITGCLFDECSATELGMDYAIYASEIVTASDKNFIQKTQFRQGDFYLGNRCNVSDGDYSDNVFVTVNLINAKLDAKMRYESEFRKGINLIGDSEIRIDVLHQLPAWAEDF